MRSRSAPVTLRFTREEKLLAARKAKENHLDLAVWARQVVLIACGVSQNATTTPVAPASSKSALDRELDKAFDLPKDPPRPIPVTKEQLDAAFTFRADPLVRPNPYAGKDLGLFSPSAYFAMPYQTRERLERGSYEWGVLEKHLGRDPVFNDSGKEWSEFTEEEKSDFFT